MKKPIFTLFFSLFFSTLFSQSTDFQHVIVMMAEHYDNTHLAQKTAFMTKEQRRDFVIAERKAFCQASQVQVIDFLEGYKNDNLVNEIQSFWSLSHNLLNAKMLP
jgi:hypothetical protein